MVAKNILIFTLAPLSIALVLQVVGDVGGIDCIAFWSAVQAFMRGENPYNIDTLLRIQRTVDPYRESAQLFLNPPWVIPFLLPIFCWDFTTSKFLLLAVNVSLTLFALRRLSELFSPLPLRYALLVGGFFPILSCWYWGQLSCFLLVGSVLALEWVTQNYRPWWKMAVALAFWSIKPQTSYLLIVVTVAALVRNASNADMLKFALLAAVPVSLITYRSDLLVGWSSTFIHSFKWGTSSLPSLVSTAISSVNRPALLMLPAGIISAVAVVLEKGQITPFRFLCYLQISSLTAAYAWMFDFSSFVIITYAIAIITIKGSTSLPKRYAYIAALTVLCLPFEALCTNNLQAYAIHPLIVVALFLLMRRDIQHLCQQTGLKGKALSDAAAQ